MDQVCTTGVSDRPTVGSNDTAKRVSGDVPAAAGGDCFDCNICLDFAVEPVVTLCGHLYCWPCIYEWLSRDAEADTSAGRRSPSRPCPVCKAAITPDTLVPLYGRGGSSSNKPRHSTVAIPRRPTVHREAVEQQSAQSSDRQHERTEPDPPTRSPRHAHDYASHARFDVLHPPPLGRGMNTIHSTAGGVLGGMAVAVLPWLFRGQVPPQGAYHLSPYHVAAVQNVNPRLRRRYMEVERSLHQIWFFLFVFVVLCLLLF